MSRVDSIYLFPLSLTHILSRTHLLSHFTLRPFAYLSEFLTRSA